VLPAEIEAHLRAGQSVVAYHHQTRRKGGVSAEIQHWVEQFAHCPHAFSAVFRAFSVRIYFVFPTVRHYRLLHERTNSFIADRWHSVFEFGNGKPEFVIG
jgi:hypothetical protein